MVGKVERASNTTPDLDPSRIFKFGIEEKILCPSGKVGYNKREDCILSLNIPLHEATNKGISCSSVYVPLPLLFGVFLILLSLFCLMFGDQDELEAFNKQKAGKGLEENDM